MLNNDVKEQSFEETDLVWAKYMSHPYWPAMVYNENHSISRVSGRRTRESFHVYFFGEVITHAWVSISSLFKYSSIKEFKERLVYFQSQAKTKKERQQYDPPSISASQLESYQKAVNQANKFNDLESDERIKQLSELMNEAQTVYSMFNTNYKKIKTDSDCENIEELFEVTDQIMTTPSVKRIFENDNDKSLNKKVMKTSVKQELKAPHVLSPSSDTSLSSSLSSFTFETTSSLTCPSITFVEESLILDAINRKSDGTFFGSKSIAEQTYAHMVKVNNKNRTLPISEFWFYLFVYHHLPSLFKNHPNWLVELETDDHVSSLSVSDQHEQHRRQLITLMKSYQNE
ncbi:unnamed protein product [Didymodactylos carnosus]|uniref:PWWP domain-containing protein n=1 Tax=Didymodactylos carnosus TaxID=1234261 RepID=A0A813RQ10_9BILA|nr:unnamed protein product [Didymodactylos carnosus]CAF3567820.1 unnamed protein product [Didymodactylos carnosus]